MPEITATEEINRLKTELEKYKQLYQDTKRSEMMLRNILDFLLYSELPDEKKDRLKNVANLV